MTCFGPKCRKPHPYRLRSPNDIPSVHFRYMAWFEELGYFPHLRKVRIYGVINNISSSPRTLSILARFLDVHKAMLETLSVVPAEGFAGSAVYISWMPGVFANLNLPALQTLTIGLSGFHKSCDLLH